MTRKQEILQAFQFFGYRIRLGDALAHPWGYKLASRISELKREGYDIHFQRGERPSDNTWVMRPPSNDNQEVLPL